MDWRFKKTGEETSIWLIGEVTENAALARLSDELSDAHLVRCDLSGITRINSAGVLQWLRFLRELCSRARVELWECPPAVVSQLNMISDFAASATVRSVQLPYACEVCSEVQVCSYDLADAHRLDEVDPPTCAVDGSRMVFDDLPELYLDFLKRAA